MSRTKGIFPFSGNFEVRYAAPLDTRLVANTIEDLINPNYWTSRDGSNYSYRGMAVSVWNDTEVNNGIYVLKNNNFQDLTNWIRISSIDEPDVEFEKMATYHFFSKIKTNTDKRIGDEIYKSTHNTSSKDVKIDPIPFAGSLQSAIENAEQFPNIIKRIGTEESPIPIYPLAGSNYLTWFIDLGEPELDIENFGFNPSIGWVRNLISPVDVMDDGLIPSFGYEFKIFTNSNDYIPYNNAFYEFDYYSGFIFFVEGRTPKDSGNGLGLFDFIDFQSKTNSLDARNFILENAPRSTSFQYVGNLFSDIKYGNGLTFSQSGELSLNIDQESGLTFSNGKLAIDIDKISIKIDKDKGLTFSEETGELQINSSNGLTFSADGALLLDISDSGLTFSDNKLAIITDDTLKVKDGRLFVSGNSVYEIRNPLNTLNNNSPTGVIISFTPLNHSTVKVFINGQSVFLGITTTGVVCYFSSDGGNTAKEYQDIVAGDELYFNSNFTGYSLSSDDSVVLIYESNL